jgi:hypothetical protein
LVTDVHGHEGFQALAQIWVSGAHGVRKAGRRSDGFSSASEISISSRF